MRRLMLMLSMLTLPVLASCGGSGGTDVGTNPPPSNNPMGGNNNSTSTSVSVGNDFFSPSSTTVPVGSTITWTWNSNGVLHDIVFNDGSVESGQKGSGTFAHTFSTAGTYPYHCSIHGSVMSGTIVVQ